MTAPVTAVLCSPWATPTDVPTAVKTSLNLPADGDWLTPLLLASELLFYLSGRHWYGGGCTQTVRVTANVPTSGTGSWPYHESWGSCGCGGPDLAGELALARHFGHPQPVAIQLPRSPITGITSVTVDGNPFTGYQLLRSGWLQRTDGFAWQPCATDTQVAFTFGEPPPAAGKQAAVALAIEIAKDINNVGQCRLPQRVTSVTRQGVTWTIVDPMEFLREGGTGLPSVDLWISAVNPGRRPSIGRVWSPDIPRMH